MLLLLGVYVFQISHHLMHTMEEEKITKDAIFFVMQVKERTTVPPHQDLCRVTTDINLSPSTSNVNERP